MRLIDADALMPNAEYKGKHDILTAYDIVAAPTIDAVPVVRCGECKHNLYPDKPNSICEFDIPIFDIYGYCSEGDRREKENFDEDLL